MNHKVRMGLFFSGAVVLFIFQSARAQDRLAALAACLERASSYEYGESRAALTDIDSLMHTVFNDGAVKKQAEDIFIRFLGSGATLASKQFISAKLGLIGTDASVPVLSAMLAKPETFDMALSALERIPAPASGKALLGMLGRSEGRERIGIINALGTRREEKAAGKLKKWITGADEPTAIASISALGHMAGRKALNALESREKKVQGERRQAVCEACLKCADSMLSTGDAFGAATVYRKYIHAGYPEAVRTAALTGWIHAESEDAGAICLDMLKKGDPVLQSAAIYHIGRIPALAHVPEMAQALPDLLPAQQVQLIGALSQRGAKSERMAVMAAAGAADEAVKTAALNALEFLGDESAVPLLAQCAAGEGAPAEAARQSLDRIGGKAMDQAFLSLLAASGPEIQTELLRSIGVRRMTGVTQAVFVHAETGDEKAQKEAIKTLGLIADPASDLSGLVGILVRSDTGDERLEAEKSVVAAANRAAPDAHPAQALLAALPSAKDTDLKASLLQVMGRIGDDQALPEIRRAIKDRNVEISKAGIRALSDWPNSAPKEELLEIAKASKELTSQVLALRGFIHLLGMDGDTPGEEKTALYKQAFALAKASEEKKLVLSGLSDVGTISALQMAGGILDDVTLQQEAEAAVIKIAGSLWRKNPEDVRQVLNKLAGMTSSEERRNQAKGLIDRIAGL